MRDKGAIDAALMARDPGMMATTVVDLKEMQRYMLWALAVLGFLVWLLIVSRGPRY